MCVVRVSRGVSSQIFNIVRKSELKQSEILGNFVAFCHWTLVHVGPDLGRFPWEVVWEEPFSVLTEENYNMTRPGDLWKQTFTCLDQAAAVPCPTGAPIHIGLEAVCRNSQSPIEKFPLSSLLDVFFVFFGESCLESILMLLPFFTKRIYEDIYFFSYASSSTLHLHQ